MGCRLTDGSRTSGGVMNLRAREPWRSERQHPATLSGIHRPVWPVPGRMPDTAAAAGGCQVGPPTAAARPSDGTECFFPSGGVYLGAVAPIWGNYALRPGDVGRGDSEVAMARAAQRFGTAIRPFGPDGGAGFRLTSGNDELDIITGRAEPSRAEPSRAEPSRAEPSRSSCVFVVAPPNAQAYRPESRSPNGRCAAPGPFHPPTASMPPEQPGAALRPSDLSNEPARRLDGVQPWTPSIVGAVGGASSVVQALSDS